MDNLVIAFPYATPKILHAVQAWDCFSGTKHTRHSTASFYTGRGVVAGGPCSARSFKMWSFESQLWTKDKMSVGCGTRHWPHYLVKASWTAGSVGSPFWDNRVTWHPLLPHHQHMELQRATQWPPVEAEHAYTKPHPHPNPVPSKCIFPGVGLTLSQPSRPLPQNIIHKKHHICINLLIIECFKASPVFLVEIRPGFTFSFFSPHLWHQTYSFLFVCCFRCCCCFCCCPPISFSFSLSFLIIFFFFFSQAYDI